MATVKYQSCGLNGHLSSEALSNALPAGQNCPQNCPYDLYSEQLSGTAFTVPRAQQQRSWLYRLRPSAVINTSFEQCETDPFVHETLIYTPNPLRWDSFDIPLSDHPVNFLQGWTMVAGAGDPVVKHGLAIYIYAANTHMNQCAMYNSDGDLLIVPQQGRMHIQTELGWLDVAPVEICVIPRGIKFRVEFPDGPSRGYILEVYDGHFELPELGPIGANGLANPRDFQYPIASFEDVDHAKFTIYNKFAGKLWQCELLHSPFDVVAWHGNYAPFKYDLNLFNTINSVSYDHPDPSIFTVLTCKSVTPGVAIADFVIFPPRWSVAQHTFRPPYFHRNCMSEFMGNIYGQYEAKEKGFQPGGASLHCIMSAHGPDKEAVEKASIAKLEPVRVAENSMSFMFESCLFLGIAPSTVSKLQGDYFKVWGSIEKRFDKHKISK